MWIWKTCLVLLLSGVPLMSATAQLSLPSNWQDMEIESKWELTERNFYTLMEAFPDESKRLDYNVRLRWSGIARRFHDVYYDTSDDILKNDLHSIRHRSRSVSVPLAENNELATLKAAHWKEQWERVQYKSTPCRIESAWLRMESGDCKLSDEDGEDLCSSVPISADKVLSGEFPAHKSITALKQDHPKLDLARLEPVLKVIDYRYRIELLNSTGMVVYEISLDRVLSTNLRTGETKQSLEAELEIVTDIVTENIIHEFLKFSEKFEKKFNLVHHRSKTSKGGVGVPDCGATGATK